MLRRYASFSQSLIISLLVLASLLIFGGSEAIAQDFTVEGTVTGAETGDALPGVNIVEVGTQRGTTTEAQGSFEISVSSEDAQLRFSFIGYETKTIPVQGRSEINVQLRPQAEQMEDVVVTALGIERQERSLGYATSEVESEDLVESTEVNPANLLQGNVPGVLVNTNAGGPSASSTVNIRGLSNLTGDNQPLYIVDGTPIISSTIGRPGRFGGFDGGTTLSIVSPNNIQSVSVLKGAGAAALYGTRARDGVILIETKSGDSEATQGGYNVNYSTTLTSRRPLSGFTDYQTQYGQGRLGLAPEDQATARNANLNSYGAPLSSVDESVQFDGETRPYRNVVDRQGFYRNGFSQKHSLSLNRSSENTSLRVSGSYLGNEAITPNSSYQQLNTSVRGSAQLGALNTEASVTYQNETTDNRTYLNDAPRNPNFLISFLPANVPKSALKPGFKEDGTELLFGDDPFQTNPYFAVNKFEADDSRNRILGNANINLDITDWLSIQGRQGLDWSRLNRMTVDPFGTGFEPEGSMYERTYTRWESNTKLLLSGTPQLTESLSLRLDLGGNLRMNQFEQIGIRGQGFNIPGLQTISNTGSPERVYDFSEQEVRSVFGSAAFTYRDYAYLTVTGRNDWSSTLPQKSNSFFYPSVSGSLVFSEALPTPDWISFGKVRASWAEIGADTGPYQLLQTYSLIGEHQGQPLGTIGSVNVPNFDLVPTNTRETEFGVELQFLNNRLGLDLSYYRRTTNNQITNKGVSTASGFQARTLNSGEVRNSGVEALLRARPVVTSEVSWETKLNFAVNESEIVSLAQDLRTDGTSRSRTVDIVQKVGSPVSTIYGTPYVRDDQGRIVHGPNGLPLEGENEVLGKGAPDWTLGLTNTISFKDVYVSALIDVKWGGQLYSGTNRSAYTYGLHKDTREGRAACEEVKTEDGYPTDGCFRPDGVTGHFEENEDGEQVVVVDSSTTSKVLPGEYYGNISSSIAEEFVYDANYINLRQIRIGYELPDGWVNQTPVDRVRTSFVARNLFYLYDSVPNVNPGAEYNTAATPGIEYASVPQKRTFGFDLSVTF